MMVLQIHNPFTVERDSMLSTHKLSGAEHNAMHFGAADFILGYLTIIMFLLKRDITSLETRVMKSEDNYNFFHSSPRIIVECTFGEIDLRASPIIYCCFKYSKSFASAVLTAILHTILSLSSSYYTNPLQSKQPMSKHC
jgi:hypothetical protein